MKSSVTDKTLGDAFHDDILGSVEFKNTKAFTAMVKRLQDQGFTEAESKEILGESDV